MEYLQIITLTMVLLYAVGAAASPAAAGPTNEPYAACFSQELPAGVTEWQNNISSSSVSVEWAYGNITCNRLSTCLGMNMTEDVALVPQLMPLSIQPGVQVIFFASPNMDVNFTIQPYWVTEQEYDACDVRNGGHAIIPEGTQDPFLVDPQFLRTGINYFIVESIDPIFKCKYGLRLNVTVKDERCTPPGTNIMCNGRGRCLTSPAQRAFECECCHGYAGDYCSDIDACASEPCLNGATCIRDANDPTGDSFDCKCQMGYYGATCAYHVDDLCTLRPCENNSTCKGNATHYTCTCASGFTGNLCEVNINECASNPCVHGVCMDKANSYQCFCIPGYGGVHCEEVYSECQSSPCKNGGFCHDKPEGWECHCGQGYEGDDCSLKVDLCRPNPCHNATECIDYGNTFSCTCRPGFTGPHCEVNVNECASSPCMNGGSCYDQSATYKCLCPAGTEGRHCDILLQPKLARPPDYIGYPVMGHRHSHLHNLSIVAGTLAGVIQLPAEAKCTVNIRYRSDAGPMPANAGRCRPGIQCLLGALLIALMVLAGCYCRLYGVARICPTRQFKYKKQRTADSVTTSPKDISSAMAVRPSAEAVMQATTPGYRDNHLNAPLMHTLKSRRV